MVPSAMACNPEATLKETSYPYDEYYLGEKDQQDRKNGDGRNHWTGAESLEFYTGRFVRDTMHGSGEYRWRYLSKPGRFFTYEGHFYLNSFHGYGVMSYPDGKVFTGLFNHNARYGPGVESFANRSQNVGLWRGGRLARLAWRPAAPALVPELVAAPVGRLLVEPHRLVLWTTNTTLGKINNAIELLKECGCDPVVAAENWTRLYPKLCTDTASQLCHVDLFKQEYYKGRIHSLKLQESEFQINEVNTKESEEEFEDLEVGPYYAWNNGELLIDMMRHCFEHERQRNQYGLDLTAVLTGPRRQFQRAAIHELDCRTLLMAAYLGHVASTTFLVNERRVDPNIADMQGNSAVMYATCGDQAEIINFLVEAGANVDSYNDACCTALGIALMRFACAQRDVPIGGTISAVVPATVTTDTHRQRFQSLEFYTGRFVRDTMHGSGEYRWRYLSKPGRFFTYEGHFYLNSFHGYGVMSYPDGKVFTGLFNHNARYGPGVESFANRSQNVGLWRGGRLARLAWRPAAPALVPELVAAPVGRLLVEPHRLVLWTTNTTLGKINNAIELLKECGCDPVVAAENWTRLYPKLCTDTASQLCHVDLFKQEYYKGRIHSLKLQESEFQINEVNTKESEEEFEDLEVGPYYAWNNGELLIDMMRHCFEHERQRNQYGLDLTAVLTGPRRQFQRAAIHELDCRTLLMAAYLGHVASTTFLVNERRVDPNIADMQGNSAVMYATCGDQAEIINFLVEAGANVDSYNDACCTALGIALMRFACAQRDVPIGGTISAVVPATVTTDTPSIIRASEWNMVRELPPPPPPQALLKSPSKLSKLADKSNNKTEKSLVYVKDKDVSAPKKKPDEGGYESDESINEENKLYMDINYEYVNRVNELFLVPSGPPNYLFDVYDMAKDIEDDKVVPEKNVKKMPSKVIKETNKLSKEAMWQTVDKDDRISMTSAEKIKSEMLERIKLTIWQLLQNGADPNLVKFPQPALYMAVVSGCADLVRRLIDHGADTNTVYPQFNNYTMVDLAISRPISNETLETIRVLLEGGARADHRLRYVVPATPVVPEYEIPGPTLLHVILSRKVEEDYNEEIRRQIMELLLDYNCDPLAQFKGRSPLDVAAKNMELLDVIVRSPKTDLNAVINDSEQTILVKMFSFPYFKTIDSNERLQMLTNLLLFGADPLIPCKNGQAEYKNLFVLTKKALSDLESGGNSHAAKQTPDAKNDKGKKEPKKEEKPKTVMPAKSSGKISSDDLGNLRMANDLITECARLLYIRWLQAKLTKELIEVIDKYKHRRWNVIFRDCRNSKAAGLWLIAPRCLEIWDLLSATKRKIYNDKRNLKHLLSIVHICYLRTKACMKLGPVTSAERDIIDRDVKSMLHEHKMAASFETEMLPLQRLYVQPELWNKADSKFEVCFECILPFEEERITCPKCKLVSFCNLECMKANTDRVGCHPCSNYLKRKYFPENSNEEIV